MPDLTGYRVLTDEEKKLINHIKKVGDDVGELLTKLSHAVPPDGVLPDQRWVSIARTAIQQGFMALTRSVAKPTNF